MYREHRGGTSANPACVAQNYVSKLAAAMRMPTSSALLVRLPCCAGTCEGLLGWLLSASTASIRLTLSL